MKFIAVTHNYGSAPVPRVFHHVSDTALLQGGKPFFIPDFANPCTARVQLAVRLCRLGRSISERYAPRYYDAVSLACTFTAENLLAELRSKALPWDEAIGFDGAVCIGRWMPLNGETDGFPNLDFALHINGQPVFEASTSQMAESPSRLVAGSSQFYMLRQGDILLTGSPTQQGQAVAENDHVEGFIDGNKVLEFNVK